MKVDFDSVFSLLTRRKALVNEMRSTEIYRLAAPQFWDEFSENVEKLTKIGEKFASMTCLFRIVL